VCSQWYCIYYVHGLYNPSRYGCLVLDSLHFTLRAPHRRLLQRPIEATVGQVMHVATSVSVAPPVPPRKLDVDLPGSSGIASISEAAPRGAFIQGRRRRSNQDGGSNAPVGLGARSDQSVKNVRPKCEGATRPRGGEARSAQ
jgi:hypothetical protein